MKYYSPTTYWSFDELYLACRSADPNDEGEIMASGATKRKGGGEDRNWSCNNGKVEEERKGEREERGDVMLRRLSEMGI